MPFLVVPTFACWRHFPSTDVLCRTPYISSQRTFRSFLDVSVHEAPPARGSVAAAPGSVLIKEGERAGSGEPDAHAAAIAHEAARAAEGASPYAVFPQDP